MKKLFLLLFLLPNLLFSQVFDDFADGDFTKNPSWTGTQQLFRVNDNFQLQLNDTIAGMAYLVTANLMAVKTEWRIWVKCSFSPSANNNARIYLVSNNQDISQLLNGYFLQLGESGSNDAIELFKQEGEALTSICRGTDGLIAGSFELRIKVNRDDQGNWKVFADPQGGDNFQLQCEGNDDTFTVTAFFGVLGRYTKSNSTKMYFDEVYVGPEIVDNEPPVWQSVAAGSDSTIILTFDETLDAQSIGATGNYFLDNGFGNPQQAYPDAGNPTIVHLEYDKKFENGKTYLLTVSGLKDLAGNSMEKTKKGFVYYLPQPFDIVINEIMADPSPQVGLPNFEYLELFNQTDKTIDLDGWILTVGTTDKVFQAVSIGPEGYLIVAKSNAEEELGSFGPFYGFSSFSLTNSGQTLMLTDNHGNSISQVSYTDKWYGNPDKEDGGWSLEQINPNNICSGKENWTASEDIKGGTPGAQNSVYNDQVLLPKIDRLEVVAGDILHIYFNQAMKQESLLEKSNFEVASDIGNPSNAYVFDDEPNLVELYFETSFQKGTVYHLTVKKSLKNCMGLNMEKDTVLAFGLAETADENDVVINEILFNPWTNGVDYVEVYNRSQKVIDLNRLQIGSIKISPPNPPDTSFYLISDEQQMLVPGEYLVLTSSPETVKKQYYTSNPNGFLRVDPFPAYNNDKGVCILATLEGKPVDVFDYSEEMQYPLLNYVDGVSLERTGFDNPTQDANNWHSAAESVGFGTPAYQNSQFIPAGETENNLTIDPEIFSPDNDGYNDVLSIKYHFDQPGYTMTVNVFNSGGQLIRHLVNNEYLGTEGSVNWDGIQDNNTKAPIGIYIFYIQVFDLNGNVKKYKKTGVLAGKLK